LIAWVDVNPTTTTVMIGTWSFNQLLVKHCLVVQKFHLDFLYVEVMKKILSDVSLQNPT